MFKRILSFGIAAKVSVALAAIAVPALLSTGLLGYTLITVTTEVEAGLKSSLTAAQRLGGLQAQVEKQYGLVARVPGELDLAKVDQFSSQIKALDEQIQAAVRTLAGNRGIVPVELEREFAQTRLAAAKTATEIVDAGKNFAQTAALELVNGPFDAQTKSTLALVDRISKNVDGLTDATHANLARSQNHALLLVMAGVLAMAAAIAFAVLFMRRSVAGPLKELVSVVGQLANGNFGVALKSTSRQDELGLLARALQVFKDNGLERERLTAEADQAQEARDNRQQALEQAIAAFEQRSSSVISDVSATATELQASARSMQQIAEETSLQSTSVASAAQQASANVQGVAAAGEELSASIVSIGDQARQSSTVAMEAVKAAEQTDRQVQELATAASRIGSVVELIGSIASQTNLLALNATIEAARAGEAGRGFAVVASEVKELAAQTTKATAEIGEIVTSIQDVTGKSLESIQAISKTIGEIDGIARTITASMDEQSRATTEIANNVLLAARGTEDVSSSIASIVDAASTTGAASAQVLNAAEDISRQSVTLRAEIGRFFEAVKAA